MAIGSTQLAIKVLFEQNHTFWVPKYQRGYAWGDDAIEDFIEDIRRCLISQSTAQAGAHFFGGIVAARSEVSGSNRSHFEIIDGQQRLASFVMLVTAAVNGIKKVLGELNAKAPLSEDEQQAKAFLSETVAALRRTYHSYRDLISMKYVEIPKLKLSDADHDYFQGLIEERKVSPSRDSHERLLSAWKKLHTFIQSDLLGTGTALDKSEKIRSLVEQVLGRDCTVIFMSSKEADEAHQIFQVLNDRGVHLTDGDLLRARTLEALERDWMDIQQQVAKTWDEILGYSPKNVDEYLRWYFSSLEGERPNKANLADQFVTSRFGFKRGTPIDRQAAEKILHEVNCIETEFGLLDSLGEGEWPYQEHSDVSQWDRERLRMLVTHLKHTNAMPLLLSLQKLEPIKFAEAVASIERFVFRFITMGNSHITPMTKLFLRHSKKIRDDSGFSIEELRTDLTALVEKSVPLPVFKTKLDQVQYDSRRGNSTLRYLLISIEDHTSWVEGGAQGVPRCLDKTRVFDFSNTTLEHVYPRSIKPDQQILELEPIKHTLGNLTIFGPGDNNSLGNKVFGDKKETFAASGLKMNREISANLNWTAKEVTMRSDRLIQAAMKIFVP
jgi:hypothetical protein